MGTGFYPDVYSMPFHSLNFNLNKTFGEERNTALNFRITNILGDHKESFFQSFEAADQYFSFRDPEEVLLLGSVINFNQFGIRII